ncbi:heme-binding protein [Thiohalocapsa marina]|uniref:Heme-binding protein n=2 Tax=Thiohalocapsa marina TaxID=424902 RepID=A0A5M8FKS2_9GAMM|nr:heme-binding protein [Thiohalocapsa marina]KAA6184580.1 heme-binding protein [Thiohalocapsa marina]
MATEEPVYTVLRTTPEFELRRYPPLRLAEVEVRGGFDSVGGEAFRLLAGYIFGDNQGNTRIDMTAPVTQRPGSAPSIGERIAMTAPVTQRPATREPDRDPARDQPADGEQATAADQADEAYVVSFIMPAEYDTLASLPRPNNPRVTLREAPARVMAVRRYSGGWREDRYQEQEANLLAAVQAAGLTTRGPPVYARYNSPFSLPVFRRNEVMIEVASEPASDGE